MKICYIFSALETKCELPKIGGEDMVIAADAGYLNLQKAGIEPDIIIGDFDSMPCPEVNVAVKKYPVLKDDTDTMLAIKHGFECGYTDFVIYGGMGGERTDHTIANIQALGYIASHGGCGVLMGENEKFTLIYNSRVELHSKKGNTLSIFAYAGNADGIKIRGAIYETDNLTLSPFFPLGVSNKFKEETATIEVQNGYVLIRW